MSEKPIKPKRRHSVLIWLLVAVLLMAVIWWLLFSPLKSDHTSGGKGTPIPTSQVKLEGEILTSQQPALDKLAADSSQPPDILAHEGQIQYLSVNVPIPAAVASSNPEKALYFLGQYNDFFQLGYDSRTLQYQGGTRDNSGNSFVHFTQHYQGVPVHGSEIAIGIDSSGAITSLSANYIPNLQVDIQPLITSLQAETIALADYNHTNSTLKAATALEIYSESLSGNLQGYPLPYLAWCVEVGSDTNMDDMTYVIDAHQGTILGSSFHFMEFGGSIVLEIREKKSGDRDYVPVMNETGSTSPSREPTINSNSVFKNSKIIFNWFNDNFGWESGYKLWLKVEVDPQKNIDYPKDECRAAYNPGSTAEEDYIWFCNEYAFPMDVMAHEFTHMVVHNIISLPRNGEAGELNEAFGDIFAALSSTEDITDPTDEGIKKVWQINMPLDKIARDLASPGPHFPTTYQERYESKDSLILEKRCYTFDPKNDTFDTKYYGDYIETYDDCAHINSIVFSHAVFLMSHDHDPANGLSRSTLSALYFDTILSGRISTYSGQQQAARDIVSQCIFDVGKHEIIPGHKLDKPLTLQDCREVIQAFSEVGLYPKIEPTPEPSPEPITIPTEWIDFFRDWLRAKINELLGPWSPVILWQQLQDFLKSLQENYWIHLVDCIRRSDQACMNQFVIDLLNNLWNWFVTFIYKNCCAGLLPPLTFFLLFFRRMRLHARK